MRANGSRERAPDDRLREAIQMSLRGNGLDCFVRFAPRNDDGGHCPVVTREPAKKILRPFVDRMFTTSIEVAFTNDFDALAANQAIA